MKRTRTLSDQGVELFLDGMFVGPKLKKRTLRNFLFSCFHSDWDDKVDMVVSSCRLSTMALYGEIWESGGAEDIPKRLSAGISNTVKLILSNDDKKVTKSSLMSNYRFFLTVMRRAHENNDHQTAMMMWLALTHMSVNRLAFHRPKKHKELMNLMEETYGVSTTCYNKHLVSMLDKDIMHPDGVVEYLPSLIACSMFLNNGQQFSKAFKVMGHRLDRGAIFEIKSMLDVISVMCYANRGTKAHLYEIEPTAPVDLFEMSCAIKEKRSPRRSLKRTKSARPVKWNEMPAPVAKSLNKDKRTSIYVHHMRESN
jgi:hypothetical protein